ncbi:hypothetical protein GTQ99_04715 [Kineococcus sp. T13]|uniref:DUF6603 domain-containing protein n=1 Tax=Kineococcus vitellinus TaxID=2696565 RepID=UPI001412B237|nr:DUF6603 domain-containing protein [Kineococcus vitellinus]NAZ74726.1 hypothetical protein [Kineococcus vitellinus]
MRVDPRTSNLLTAVGLTDADGHLLGSWFEDPLAAIRRVLVDPAQRSALLRLLDELLPPDPSRPGWYPLLDTQASNLFLTVEDDVIGLAGVLRSSDVGSGVGEVLGSVRLPLLSVAGDLEAIAGTARGPLLVGVDVEFPGDEIPMAAVGAAVSVHLDDAAPPGVHAGVRVTVNDFHLGDDEPVDLVVDSDSLGADLVRVLQLLLKEVVDTLAAEAGDNGQLARLADHLFELLGMSTDGSSAIPPLPLEELFRRPEAMLDWLVDIVDTPATLATWATHLAGLIGDDLPVAGSGSQAQPFRARLLDSDVVDLFLSLLVTADRELEIGLEVRVDAGPVALTGTVTVLRVPLPALAGLPADPAAPPRRTAVVPEVIVALVAPAAGELVSNNPTVQVGNLGAGFRLTDGTLVPWLTMTDVLIDGQEHGVVDLTDADAVIGVATDAALAVLEDAFGDSPAARALLTLLGLRRPDSDPTFPHRIDPAALGRDPTLALGELHRGILQDPAHPWSHMLEQVAVLVGLTPAVTGAGTGAHPWRIAVAAAGSVSLSLAAWNARTEADPAGLQRLRLGLWAGAADGAFKGRLLVELLAIDLPATGAGSVALIGRSQLLVELTPDGPLELSGLQLTSGPATASAGWRPGEPPTWQIGLTGVTVTVDGAELGPYSWVLPGLQGDLGLGSDAIRLLGQVLSSALRTWAGEPAYVVAALLGLHRDLPALPDDWPLLADLIAGADQLQVLLDDPATAVRAHLHQALTGMSPDGVPRAGTFLELLGRLLPGAFSTGDPFGGAPELPAARPISGSGTYDDPWILRMVQETADAAQGVTSVDGLAWLDPAGPPANWITAIAQRAADVSDGARLADFLAEASAFRPPLTSLLAGRDAATLAAGFDALAAWLADGDGLVPLTAQLPAGWAHGTTVTVPHGLLPRDPAVIIQVVGRLAAGGGPVLLVAPPFTDHSIFTELVTAISGAPPVPGGHADLRALPDPAEVDLSVQLTAVAPVYTADLLPDAPLSEVDQLRRVVERVRALTGQPVRVVGHSTAGVVARHLAASRPDLVADLVTIGSPHAGSDVRPLVDPVLADALRVAASVAGPVADSALGASVGQLAALLDGADGALGGAVRSTWFAGAPVGLVDPVPGLAIGSRIGGDLLGLLAGATLTGLAGGEAPTHVAFGVRLGLTTPRADPAAASPGDITLSADARVDLARLRLLPDAPEPPRAATALGVDAVIYRPDGWLVGEGTLPPGPITARVRRVEAGVTVAPAAPGAGAGGVGSRGGALAIAPRLHLVDAAVAAGPVRKALTLTDEELRLALDAVLAELTAALANPAAQAAVDLLAAAGLVIDTTEGFRASIHGLADLATVPVRTLTERRAALLTALLQVLGDIDTSGIDLGGLDPGSFSVAPPALPLRLSLDDTTLIVRLETTSNLTLAGPFRLGGRLDLDTRTLATALDVSLVAGPAALRRDLSGTITVVAHPWLSPALNLRPLDPIALRAKLLDLVVDLTLSAVTTALLGGFAGSGGVVPPVSALIRDPGGWLRSPTALGNDAGQLAGEKVNDLLRTIGGALGLDDSQGLALPGDFVLRASGADPLRLELSGTFGDADGPVGATVALAVDLAPGASGPVVTPAGSITLDLDLPGDWGEVTMAFSVDSTGVHLLVSPENVTPIQLLPTVTGLGELLGSTLTALVPKVLQEITDALRPQTPHPVLDVALDVAEALGIYDPAASGFLGSAQAERLRHMLDPGWLKTQVSDPALLIGHIERLFGAGSGSGSGPVPLPPGHRILRTENRLRWQMDLLPGCELGVELGWAAAGHPQVRVTLTGLDTGPVTIVQARLGYLDGVEGLVRLRLEVGDPLDWFTPELEIDLAGDRLAVRLLPLGEAAADDVEVVLLPEPAFVLTPQGGLQLTSNWLLPLVVRYVLPHVEDLLERPLWPSGPTAHRVLRGAGLLTSDSGPIRLVTRFPEPAAIGMGALQGALSGVSVDVTDDLELGFSEDDGRLGIRLRGSVTFPGDIAVTLLFGSQDWIGVDAGVTAWLVGPSTDPQLPVAPAPGLDVVGVGLQIAGSDADHPLFGGEDGAVRLGGLAATFFGEFAFWDPATSGTTFVVDGLGAAVELTDAVIRVDGSDGDSFVAQLIPQELGAGFTTAIAYRDDRLEVHGGPGDLDNGIELTFPLDLDILDLLYLRELYLAAVLGQHSDIVAALSGNATLGPIAVAVTRVGLRAAITGSGAALSFKPPDGFGFSLDASTVRLGGFLLVDEARGRYVGALEIAVLEKFALTAIGIVTTKAPDGSPGFSVLMLITVTLPVPIPLGFGFFFAGAGGLLGLNRGMDVDRIRDGLRNGTADSILFPTDIINRIDVIVRDLEEAFPAQEGHFLIAPMALLTWMNPPLVTLKVGLVLEIAPQPNIALLGVLRLALPTADAAIVDLKVAFLGGIDIAAGLLYFDAAIYDSFIGLGDFKLSLEGDIAIRLSWGARPDLVVSIGGFHPSYSPAAHLRLPSMRRLTLSLLKDNPRLTLRLYFALTSNTIQFGAQLELFVGVEGFSISGELGFDVLVQFAPFLIDAHMWGQLAVTAGGTDICSISLDLTLRGPTPWYAYGRASFKILFFKVTVEVEATFGERHETTIPAEPVLPKVLDQLRDPLNWSAELSETSAGVTLLPLPTGELVVDAGGLLAARQNLIPLATDIGLVGKTPPSDVSRVTITGLAFGTQSAPSGTESVPFDDVTAAFSPATFAGAKETGADLLKAPAFEDRPHGVRAVAGQSLEADVVLHHPQRFELIVIDDPDPAAPTPPAVPVTPRLVFSRLVPGGTTAASAPAAQQRRLAERGKVRQAVTAEPRFAVTSTHSLAPLDDDGRPVVDGAGLLSRSEAEQRLAALAGAGAADVRYQVVPEVQVVR